MRIFIKTVGKKSMVVYKETTLQSILSDLMTIMVIIILIGSDIVFSMLVTRSFVIDTVVTALFLLYLFGFKHRKEEVKSGVEVFDMLSDLLPKPKPIHFIFGEEVCREYLNGGMEALQESIESGVFFKLYTYTGDVFNLLSEFKTWDEYAYITEEEYKTISAFESYENEK
jgi:hypothetical protein